MTTTTTKTIQTLHSDFKLGKISHNEYITDSLQIAVESMQPLRTALQIKLDELNWLLKDLAERLGCTQPTVTHWSKRNTTPECVLTWLDDCIAAKNSHPNYPAPPAWQRRKRKQK